MLRSSLQNPLNASSAGFKDKVAGFKDKIAGFKDEVAGFKDKIAGHQKTEAKVSDVKLGLFCNITSNGKYYLENIRITSREAFCCCCWVIYVFFLTLQIEEKNSMCH